MKSKKRRRRARQDRLVLQLLIIVAVVLVVFDGRLVLTMTQHRSIMNDPEAVATSGNADPSDENTEKSDRADNISSDMGTPAGESALAGLPADIGSSNSTSGTSASSAVSTVANPDSPAIVHQTDPPVDDSYFSDAVFIGDSRMEGFRNASGITQGRFITSVGMSLASMTSGEVIQTADGNITVAAALSGGSIIKYTLCSGRTIWENMTGTHSGRLYFCHTAFQGDTAGCDHLYLQRHLCRRVQGDNRRLYQ